MKCILSTSTCKILFLWPKFIIRSYIGFSKLNPIFWWLNILALDLFKRYCVLSLLSFRLNVWETESSFQTNFQSVIVFVVTRKLKSVLESTNSQSVNVNAYECRNRVPIFCASVFFWCVRTWPNRSKVRSFSLIKPVIILFNMVWRKFFNTLRLKL